MYLAFDCETGGIPNAVTLLTVWFGVFDEDFNLIDSLDLRLKPDDGLYVIEPRALEINKIDLVEHDKVAVTYKQSKGLLYSFLQRNALRNDGQLIPVGHNVNFDITKVTENLISKGTWDEFVSYRALDTAVIAQFLRISGKIPNDVEAGLGKLIKYFGVEVEGNAHEAKYDAVATMAVLRELMSVVGVD